MKIVIKTDRSICINPSFIQVTYFVTNYDVHKYAITADGNILKTYKDEMAAIDDLEKINTEILDGFAQKDNFKFVDLMNYYYVDPEDIPF